MQRSFLTGLWTCLLIGVATIVRPPAVAVASSADDLTQLTAALDELDKWVGAESNGDKWRKFLATRALRGQMAQGDAADPAVVAQVLHRYETDIKGLDMRKFVAVRQRIQAWLDALQEQYSDDLPKLAWACRGDYRPVPKSERLATSRAELRKQAHKLEQRLGTDSSFAEQWKKYLRWDRLQPHLSDDVTLDENSFAEVTAVLRRFRSEAEGLHQPVFTETAQALDHYRALLGWYQTVDEYARRFRKSYDAPGKERRSYILQMQELEKQLTRHLESPTIETTRKVGQLLGVVETLGQSPQLVQAIRSHFTSPNVYAQMSESAMNRLAQRPVSEVRPVRDFILGARIRGTAVSTGELTLRTLPSEDNVTVELQIAGNVQSDTVGYRKPVKISNRGSTDFVATKQVHISDERFVAMPSTATAKTNNRTCSVKKTGGRFGTRLVERIAWKKVRESKSQGEYIASQRTKQKLTTKFDNDILQAMTQARRNYDSKVRPPLMRVGMFPEYLQMASTDHSVGAEATLASYEQLAPGGLPLSVESPADLSVQVHETVANNLLPTILAGVKIKQDQPDQPPHLEGDYPSWLEKLIQESSNKRQLTVEAEDTQPADQDAQAEQAAADQQATKADFKPFSMTFNGAHPVSVKFDDQQVKLRIRFAELVTVEEGEEQIREDWDFIVTFQVDQAGDGVVLRRVGNVEAFPTGFDTDPRWGDKLTGEQVATRGALTKILNKRAEQEEGFPTEIKLPPVEIPISEGVTKTLLLKDLICDDGWLTIGYQLP